MPVALGIGLTMLLIASTSIVMSAQNTTISSQQKSTAQSLYIAEVGVSRVQGIMGRHRGLMNLNHNYNNQTWSTALNTSACPQNSTSSEVNQILAPSNNGWVQIGTSNNWFRIVRYVAPPGPSGNGILTVEGQVREANNQTVSSSTTLDVTLPVLRDTIPEFAPPGAWANVYPSLGNNRILSSTVVNTSCTNILPNSTNTQTKNFPQTTTFVNNPAFRLPPPVAIPSGVTPIALNPANDPNIPTNITSSITLPRPEDITRGANSTDRTEFIYIVNSIDLSGSSRVIIRADYKVTIYLTGNIRTQGSASIAHNCFDRDHDGVVSSTETTLVDLRLVSPSRKCAPTDFQVYGGTNTTSISLGGGAQLEAFILAPNATFTVNGGGGVKGAVWVNQIGGGASGSTDIITQTASWDNIPPFVRPASLGPIAAWGRTESN